MKLGSDSFRTWSGNARLSQATKTGLARRARTDPDLFLRMMLAGPGARAVPGLAAVHRELQRHLSMHPRAVVEMPRDHGKTTQVCLRVLWELGRNPDLRVRIVCASEAIARDRSRFLRTAIEQHPVLRRVFPELLRGEEWQAMSLRVKRRAGILGPSVAATGIAAASTGTRADLLICDDVVDVKSIYSAATRERVAQEFFNNQLNLLEPDGRFWGLSTPWHADDLNARLRKNAEFTLFRRAIGTDLIPLWRERWPRRELLRRRAEIGAAAFARGYHLTPVAQEELVIRPEWVQAWHERPAAFERVIFSVDPAVSVKPTADRSALVVLGKQGETVYCLVAQAQRLTAPALVEWIGRMHDTWRPDAIVFESNGAFDAVRALIARHAAFGPKVVGVVQSRSKLARFSAFAVMVQAGRFLVGGDGVQAELEHEMKSYPFGERDDLLDAACTGAMWLVATREPRMWLW